MEIEIQNSMDAIKAYPEKYIPISKLAEIIAIDNRTLSAKARRKEFPTKFDGYKYLVSKKMSRKLAIRNRSAILGWVRQKEIIEEFSVRRQSVAHICKSHDLHSESDICGYVRFPNETTISLKEILPNYLSQETLEINGDKYYSVTRLSVDMAKKITPKSQGKKFLSEKERVSKCIYKWIEENKIPYHKSSGRTSYYVPENIYDDLTDMIRVKDANYITGLSKVTIYNWIRKGFINHTYVTDTCRMISCYDLDSILIVKFQLKLAKKHPTRMDEVADFSSLFWKDTFRKVTLASSDFNKIRKDLSNKNKIDYIERVTGFSKAEIRSIYAVKKRRGRNSWSDVELDKVKYEEGSSVTHGDCLGDENAQSPYDEVVGRELEMCLGELALDKKEIIEGVFGINGKKINLTDMAEERGVSLEDIEIEISKTLDELKLKLS